MQIRLIFICCSVICPSGYLVQCYLFFKLVQYKHFNWKIILSKKWSRTFFDWSRSVRFWVSDDTRTGISTILKRDQYTFNFRFKDFWRYHVILHRFYFNLKQSDKKSDQPGILGPGRPFENCINSSTVVYANIAEITENTSGNVYYK